MTKTISKNFLNPEKPITSKDSLNLAYKTLIPCRSTTSDTNFRFWHLQFTNFPMG